MNNGKSKPEGGWCPANKSPFCAPDQSYHSKYDTCRNYAPYCDLDIDFSSPQLVITVCDELLPYSRKVGIDNPKTARKDAWHGPVGKLGRQGNPLNLADEFEVVAVYHGHDETNPERWQCSKNTTLMRLHPEKYEEMLWDRGDMCIQPFKLCDVHLDTQAATVNYEGRQTCVHQVRPSKKKKKEVKEDKKQVEK